MESINRMAVELVDEALDFADELNVAPYELDSGATVLDFGVEADGGVEAGVLLAEIQTAGLSTVTTRMGRVDGAPVPHVELSTDHPGVALLCSQKAGWELDFDVFDGLGSGPARALVGEESEFEAVGYYDEFDLTVLAVESIELPDEQIAAHVADLAGVEESGVFLPTFALGSIAGSVAAGARAPETAVWQLFEAGYDPDDVLSVSGTAPVAPVGYDESEAMARTNDALAYGGEVHLTVARDDEDAFASISSDAGAEFDEPFADIFEAHDWDFEALPASVFGPAAVTVDVADGPTYRFGERNEALLAESFGF
ncbi:methenyltetrahydromethanopterin cyclohydrolase [Halolamina sp. CBA1230]|uniref:methenyltetrahydromethanopterin cyclohydrolase n=1 Tax=Halolamina sp. CBA1230 TaxID=1853690 RepID=UPI0009A1AB2D|nr:methenyltetrahydromethanopterin cyclohydrolase [Halolamina sp. CBA1230]QKY19107.1 methenyltetrahydromethanopterin cyclohydrolase [Halolamina sp. CBA1230]